MARARPKSATRSRPSAPKSRLAGLMSRWTNPCRWAWSSARAASRPTTSAWAGVSRCPASSMVRRLPPARYSVTRNGVPSLVVAPVVHRQEVRVAERRRRTAPRPGSGAGTTRRRREPGAAPSPPPGAAAARRRRGTPAPTRPTRAERGAGSAHPAHDRSARSCGTWPRRRGYRLRPRRAGASVAAGAEFRRRRRACQDRHSHGRHVPLQHPLPHRGGARVRRGGGVARVRRHRPRRGQRRPGAPGRRPRPSSRT